MIVNRKGLRNHTLQLSFVNLQVTLNLTSLETRAAVVTLFQARQVNTWVRWLWSALTVRMEEVWPLLCLKCWFFDKRYCKLFRCIGESFSINAKWLVFVSWMLNREKLNKVVSELLIFLENSKTLSEYWALFSSCEPPPLQNYLWW